MGGIVTDLWTCNRPLNPKNTFTIDKILTKSIFSVNVNVVRLRNFSGLVYAHFPFYALIIFLFFHCVTRVGVNGRRKWFDLSQNGRCLTGHLYTARGMIRIFQNQLH